jgi:hypothetical protein
MTEVISGSKSIKERPLKSKRHASSKTRGSVKVGEIVHRGVSFRDALEDGECLRAKAPERFHRNWGKAKMVLIAKSEIFEVLGCLSSLNRKADRSRGTADDRGTLGIADGGVKTNGSAVSPGMYKDIGRLQAVMASKKAAFFSLDFEASFKSV